MIVNRFLGTLGALSLGFVLLVSGSANATTIFEPTDGDVNFLISTLPDGTLLSMWDDSDMTFVGDSLAISVPEMINFTAGGNDIGDFTATNEASATLNLTASDRFILGISTDGGTNWSGDTGVDFLGANSYNVNFSNGTVLTIDVEVIEPPQEVPVPAAIWLFGFGLLGLIGIARQRKSA